MNTKKIVLAYTTALLVTFTLGFCQSLYLTSLGVPWLICALISFYLGFKLPTKIVAWILREELAELMSEQQKEE